MKWMPIETAPRDGTVILGWRFYVVAIKWVGGDKWPWQAVTLGSDPRMAFMSNAFKAEDRSLTHWMPIPAPPESA